MQPNWPDGWCGALDVNGLLPTVSHICFRSPGFLVDAKLTSIGLPASRAEAIRHLARAVSSHEIDFNTVTDSYTLLSRLGELPGIGNWTTQYVAMRALGEPDAFPAGDIGLLRTLRISSPRALEARAEKWRPWRAYASMYLWHFNRGGSMS